MPLDQTFIGITEKQRVKRNDMMNKLAYEKTIKALERDKQVMIFVHSRKETHKTADAIVDLASKNFTLSLFENIHNEKFTLFKRDVEKSRNKELQNLFYKGVGIHHVRLFFAMQTVLTKKYFVIRLACLDQTVHSQNKCSNKVY